MIGHRSSGFFVDTCWNLWTNSSSVSPADVTLLDHSMDTDHHRSVLTFCGPPDAIIEAAFRAVRLATDLIDLRKHVGVHPRIGATDVVPFIPIRGTTMQDCVQLAKRLGERVGRELEIPVFLYERAAGHVDRAQLESVRRGGLEGLAAPLDCMNAREQSPSAPGLH
jgi:glutamate formiminotransferase / formiminotetrahydrofolate cyclodeaminase